MDNFISPFPNRKIAGDDFNQLVDHVNKAIDLLVNTNDRLQNALEKIEVLNSDNDRIAGEFKKEIDAAKTVLYKIEKKNKRLAKQSEQFYGRQIELFGIFIAIFSFIIAGIQISAKIEGDFWKVLLTSSAIFIPILAAITALLGIVKLIIKK